MVGFSVSAGPVADSVIGVSDSEIGANPLLSVVVCSILGVSNIGPGYRVSVTRVSG